MREKNPERDCITTSEQYSAIYCMGLCGYELNIDPTGENVFFRYYAPTGGNPTKQRTKIRYTAKGRAYFLVNGRRIHLDKCLRLQQDPS